MQFMMREERADGEVRFHLENGFSGDSNACIARMKEEQDKNLM